MSAPDAPRPRYGFRVLVLLFAVPATYFFTFWLPGSLLALAFPGAAGLQSLLASAVTLFVAWWLWTRLGRAHHGLITRMVQGGAIVGGVGFCLGFFGPILFAPGANQGPLLGIFITGPLGFVIGCVGGMVYWFRTR